YVFSAAPGKYRISVFKAGLNFPSQMLMGYKDDGEKVDIYHGEIVSVTEDGAQITVNIPLDPVGAVAKPSRLILRKIGRRVHLGLSLLGFLAALVSLYIAPRWYVWALLALHVSLFLLFRRLSKVKKPKGWGIVYDIGTKKPVGRVIARLFDAQFNKLVDTELTDKRGRYAFLVGNSKYYATFERQDYDLAKTEVVDLAKQEEGIITLDIGLKPKSI
ncbi:hypothetical protein KKA13_02460, partial [Patescibacteria group bacterium]|nr:hypothetical protein [Patescibacteria group bacterium]